MTCGGWALCVIMQSTVRPDEIGNLSLEVGIRG
jgi:hypothetical protein